MAIIPFQILARYHWCHYHGGKLDPVSDVMEEDEEMMACPGRVATLSRHAGRRLCSGHRRGLRIHEHDRWITTPDPTPNSNSNS